MKPFELYISYVSWGSQGKLRPILVFYLKAEIAYVYPITSQYETKSVSIRAKYFKITNWSQAGLDKQSYVDTRSYFSLPSLVLKDKVPIGELSSEDKQKFLEFLTKTNT